MKKLLACSLVLCSFSVVHAQSDWFNPANEWTFHVSSGWVGEGLERIKPAGDTIIDNQVWAQLTVFSDFKSGTSFSHQRLVRQDGSRLYAMANGTTPFLMYDFELAVGDSIHLPLWGIFDAGFGYVVKQVSDTLIGGVLRRSQTVEWFSNTPNSGGSVKGSFIEGIGYVLGTHIIGGEDCLSDSYFFLDEPAALISDGPERIFCSFSSDWGVFEGLGLTFCKVLPTTAAEIPNIEVYPNPSQGQINVRFDPEILAVDITLTDLSGRLLSHEVLASSGSIVTSFKGSAVLTIQTADGRRMLQRVQIF